MPTTDRWSSPVGEALSTALAGNPSAFAGQPSQLRLKLTRLLGDDAHTYRADVHLVVTALDENVPAELLAAAPLSTADLHRHAQILAQARGWTDDAAQTAIGLWVGALGIEAAEASGPPSLSEGGWVVSTPSTGSISSSDPDRAPERAPDRVPDPSPDLAPGPVADHARPSLPRPDGVGFPVTSGAEDASTVLPPDRRLDPMATELPDRSSVVAMPPEPTPFAPSPAAAPRRPDAPVHASGAAAAAATPWPASSRFAVAQAVKREGFPLGAYYAFRGQNPHLRYAAVAVFAVLAAASLVLPAGLPRMIVLLALIGSVLVMPLKVVRNGIMVVDDNGFRWYSALSRSGPPELNVAWATVQLAPGNPPRLLTPQGDLWLKGHRGLVEALASRTPTAQRAPSSPAGPR